MKHKRQSLIIFSSFTAAVIHIINRIENSLYTSNNHLIYSENKYYEWRFGKIKYIKKGCGTPILLIHDLSLGSSGYEFHRIIDKLSENHEVYAIDLLGYGLSDKPNITYTNYLYVQFIIDFIKNVIKKKADIIATGDSVQIAVMACHNDPEAVNHMVFINPQNIFELNKIPSKQTKLFKLLLDTPILGTFIYNLLSKKELIEKDFKNKYFYNPDNIDEHDILSYMKAAHFPDYSSKYAFSSYTGKYMNTNIWNALKEINHSIAIIAGEEKKNIKNTVSDYSYYNNSIGTIVIKYAKHLPNLEMSDKTIEHIKLFIDE